LAASRIDYNKRKLKTENTLMTNFGVKNAFQLTNSIETKRINSLQKYGSESYFSSEINKSRMKNKENNPTYEYNNIINLDKLTKKFFIDNFIFNNSFLKKECMEFFNISSSTVNRYKKLFCINQSNIKHQNNKIEYRINNLFNNEFTVMDRNLINPLEIDLLSYDNKFGVEYNGVLWHSFGTTYPNNLKNLNNISQKRHFNKTNMVENKNFKLFQIFENEWSFNNFSNEIWINIINLALRKNKHTKINARDLSVSIIDQYQAEEFLDNNCFLKTSSFNKLFIGLTNKNSEIFIIMEFEQISNVWSLNKCVSKNNVIIRGGFSKLLNYFEKKYNPKELTVKADRRITSKNKNIFLDTGFILSNISEEECLYINLSEMIFRSKKYLQNIFYGEEIYSDFDNYITSKDYRIVYNSGYLNYKKQYETSNRSNNFEVTSITYKSPEILNEWDEI
jgi:hypothetical protein